MQVSTLAGYLLCFFTPRRAKGFNQSAEVYARGADGEKKKKKGEGEIKQPCRGKCSAAGELNRARVANTRALHIRASYSSRAVNALAIVTRAVREWCARCDREWYSRALARVFFPFIFFLLL